MKITAIFITIFVFLTGISIASKYDRWQTFTSTDEIRDMTLYDDTIHVISSGGWLKIDALSGEMEKIVNTDGLGTNDLHTLIRDVDNTEWLAGFGRLIKCSDGQFIPYLFFDRDDRLMTLYSIADDDDQLWIGTSSGLARFSKMNDSGQIEDIYSRFGNLQAEPTVMDILLTEDSIWIATSSGLAIAERTDPNLLKSFAGWNSIKPSDYLPISQDDVNALSFYNGDLYVGLTDGAYRININSTDTSFVRLNTRDDIDVKKMKTINGLLYLFSTGGYFIYNGATTIWNNTPEIPTSAFAAGIITDGDLWLGTSSEGIFNNNSGQFLKYDDGGLPGNRVTSVAVDDNNRVAAGLKYDGIATYENNEWINENFSNIRDGFRSVAFDPNNALWVGNWGGGVQYLDADTTINFLESNSDLHGVPGAPWYVVVNSLTSHGNHVFMVNYLPSDQNSVAVVDINNHENWVSFGLSDGLPADFLISIGAYDELFVVGTPDNGVYYYYYGDDIFDKTDDSVINLTEANSRLGSDQINAIRFDDEGTIWVCTNLGLSRYDRGIDRFTNVTLPLGLGPKVNDVAFDGRGNIWIGTINGLGLFNTTTSEIKIYTDLNSGLPDDEITALSIDMKSLDIWIGTNKGLSRFGSNIGPPVENIENVIAFPNPFVIRSGSDKLSFNYGKEAILRIYTSAGELLWEDNINIPWPGKNLGGEDVAPGVYLFMLEATDGSTGKGKIFLVRE